MNDLPPALASLPARHTTEILVAAMEDHPRWPGDEELQNAVAIELATTLFSMPTVMAAAMDAHRQFSRALVAALGPQLPGMITTAVRRHAHTRAREQHRAEGVPDFISGRCSPSGCMICGRDRHHHTEMRDLAIGAHRFEAVTVTDQDHPGDRAAAMKTTLLRMRLRRNQRAAWFRARGYDPCAVCRVPSAEHRGDHIVLTEGADPWAPADHERTRGPYEPPSDAQVLAYVVRERRERWHDFADPYDGYDAWDEEGRAQVLAEADPYDDYDRFMD